MQLSKKKKSFSRFVATCSKSELNFEHFERKDHPHSFCISEMTDFKNVLRYMSKKSRFSATFDKIHGKRVQALLKAALQHFYHIPW